MGRGSPHCNARVAGPAAGTLLAQLEVHIIRPPRVLSPASCPPDKELVGREIRI